MPSAPEWFANSLRNYDSKLHLRWGEKLGQWCIERDAVITQEEIGYMRKRKNRTKTYANSPPPNATPRSIEQNLRLWLQLSEELAAARLNRRIILFVRELAPAVFDLLAAADISRYGGYARFADELERAEERSEAEAERILANKRNAYNKEVWSMLDHVWRKKEDKLLNGERDLGVLLHGKHSEEPLITLTDI
jgi:hypothetical protein